MLQYAAGYLSQKAPIFFAGDFCSVSLNITFFIETRKYDKSETKQEMAILSFKGRYCPGVRLGLTLPF